MTDSFKDKFVEIAGLWPTKSGKGFSGKLKMDVDAEQQIFVFDNKSDNPKAPRYKMFIERKVEQPRIPTEKDNIEDDQVPF